MALAVTEAPPTDPFINPALVSGYEAWYEAKGRRADRLEMPC